MSLRRAPVAVLALGLALGACAYYNGLYNAQRLAGDAARSSREGRPAQARALWEQAAVKAESVAARYPRSKYWDDAVLLQGEALSHAGQCARAITPLAVAADSGRDPLLRARAALTLGSCYVTLGAPRDAVVALTPLVSQPDPALAVPARLWRARAALLRGDAAAALADLDGVPDPLGGLDRAAALAAVGRPEDAARVLRDRVTDPYREDRWLGVLDSLGRGAPDAVSALVDSLAGRRDLTPGQRARLLVGDGRRWRAAGQGPRERDRLAQAVAVAPDSLEGRAARVRLILIQLRGAEDLGTAMKLAQGLERAADNGGVVAGEAARARRVLDRAQTAGEGEHADLRRFLAAEQVRDSLDAVPLAAALFRELPQRHPASAIAPKALLAAAALIPADAESLLALLERDYPTSPYRLVVLGSGAERFAAVEDSIRDLLSQLAPVEREPARPVTGDETEIRRPPRAPRPAPGRGVPEP